MSKDAEFPDIESWLNAQFPWPKGWNPHINTVEDQRDRVLSLSYTLRNAESLLKSAELVANLRDAAVKGICAKDSIKTQRKKTSRRRK